MSDGATQNRRPFHSTPGAATNCLLVADGDKTPGGLEIQARTITREMRRSQVALAPGLPRFLPRRKILQKLTSPEADTAGFWSTRPHSARLDAPCVERHHEPKIPDVTASLTHTSRPPIGLASHHRDLDHPTRAAEATAFPPQISGGAETNTQQGQLNPRHSLHRSWEKLKPT